MAPNATSDDSNAPETLADLDGEPCPAGEDECSHVLHYRDHGSPTGKTRTEGLPDGSPKAAGPTEELVCARHGIVRSSKRTT